MAISPPGDIIFDVARSADPVQFQRAMKRLQALAGERASSIPQTYPGSSTTGAAKPGTLGFSAEMSALSSQQVIPQKDMSSPLYRSFQKLEAFLLSQALELMFPKELEFLSSGQDANKAWRGVFAGAVATEISKAGPLGIADRLYAEAKKRLAADA